MNATLALLLRHAGPDDSAIREAATRAGLLWQCPQCSRDNPGGRPCEQCGTATPPGTTPPLNLVVVPVLSSNTGCDGRRPRHRTRRPAAH
jgi:hypothetical protein